MSKPDGPRTLEVRFSTIGLVATVLAAALAIGVGAYFIGRGTGEDLEAARTAGAQAGHRKGAAIGAAEGYAMGFKRGREAGFKRTYPKAYRKSYAKAFEEAGLEAPEAREIKVSSPSG
ncbi:MAG: hypothetical protein M3Y75_04475 [Actinomycetota bacterium]|nr:hypothetical protein [Actinomycetota bacterium]